jgi:hypothetical protein
VSIHWHLTDGRNPARLTLADRKRECARASVSPLWTTNPFGMRAVEVLPLIQPGVWRKDGKPVGDASTFNARLGAFIDELPARSELGGKRFQIWPTVGTTGDGQTVTAIDLTRLDVLEEWTNLLLESFSWAGGIHHDYLTDMVWLDYEREQDPAKRIPLWFWKAWDACYAFALTKLKDARHDWVLLGQQFHLTSITPYVQGLYVEEWPGRSGPTLVDHGLAMTAHGRGQDWSFEVRNPNVPPPGWSMSAWQAYLAQVVQFVRERDCFLSWDRDATALVGAPR